MQDQKNLMHVLSPHFTTWQFQNMKPEKQRQILKQTEHDNLNIRSDLLIDDMQRAGMALNLPQIGSTSQNISIQIKSQIIQLPNWGLYNSAHAPQGLLESSNSVRMESKEHGKNDPNDLLDTYM